MHFQQISFALAAVVWGCGQIVTPAAADPGAGKSALQGGLSVEALVLHEATDGIPLITAEDLPTDPAATFEAGLDDLGADEGRGVKIKWGLNIGDQDWRFEAFFVNGFDGGKTFFDFTPGESTNAAYAQAAGRTVDTENSEQAHAYTFDYQSQLAGIEANLPAQSLIIGNAFVRPLIGARALYYGYDLSSIAYDDQASFQGAGTNIDRVKIEGHNLMVGPQLGVDMSLPLGERLLVGVTVKGSLLANRMRTSRKFSSDDDPTNLINRTSTDFQWSHALEIAPQASFQISNNISLTARGTLLWLSDIAEASNEYRIASVGNRGALGDGQAFFYGASLGLTYHFHSDNVRHSRTSPAAWDVDHGAVAGAGKRVLTAAGLRLATLRDHVPLTTADDDVNVSIGREIETDDVGSRHLNGVKASLTVPMSGKDLKISAFYAGRGAKTGTFTDPASRTSPSYTFAVGRDVMTDNSVGTAVLQFSHEDHIVSAESSVAAPIHGWGISGVKALFGGRGIYYGTDLSSTVYSDLDDFAGADNEIDRVAVSGRNFLVGPQLGLEATARLTGQITLTGSAKAGLFANYMTGERRFSSDNNAANTIRNSSSKVGFARALEIDAQFEIPLNDRVLLEAGAMALWLDGITDAAGAYRIASDADKGLDNDGRAVFYGAYVGAKVALD